MMEKKMTQKMQAKPMTKNKDTSKTTSEKDDKKDELKKKAEEEKKKIEEAKRLEEQKRKDEESKRISITKDIKLASFNSMKTILSARKYDMIQNKKYADFITDDLIDKLILKYSSEFHFTVIVYLSSYDTQLSHSSKGYIGQYDFFVKSEYMDENFICQTFITMINRKSRDPKRKPEMGRKVEIKIKKIMLKEMERFLIGKTWDLTNPVQDSNSIVDNILEKLKFKYNDYYFTVNTLLRNDDFGFTSYSSSYFYNLKEDL